MRETLYVRRLLRAGVILSVMIVSGGYLSFAGGCASTATTRPASMSDRQEGALHDPFGYTPNVKSTDMTVSGHGNGFDKQGFDRDANSILNP
ncbi:MAG TPA: hypothetical protein VLJ39_09985 [Tepidisphaeraceae bacterium]|nr:hypothetical protein [Tepidisphaeraceae bacterium]